MKTVNAQPLWLARLLSGHRVYRIAFSKMGHEYRRHREALHA